MDERDLRRVLAPNPSAFTGEGTNTWIVGRGEVAVIDPGPALAVHLEAVLAALAPGERVTAILVTHAHADHSGLAGRLAARTGAPVLGFGPAEAGRSALMQALAAKGLKGGEGVDAGFAPDRPLADGEAVEGPGWRLEALHTPGHHSGHLSLAWGDTLFSGDHVMGWSTSIVSPPDGDMGAYMASLDRLQGGGWRRFLPGHGAPIGAPEARLAELVAHRRGREAQVLAALARGPQTLPALTRQVYADTPPALWPAAQRNALAHMIDLVSRGLATASPEVATDAVFALA